MDLDAVTTHCDASAKKASDENAAGPTGDPKTEVDRHVLLQRGVEIVMIRANTLQ